MARGLLCWMNERLEASCNNPKYNVYQPYLQLHLSYVYNVRNLFNEDPIWAPMWIGIAMLSVGKVFKINFGPLYFNGTLKCDINIIRVLYGMICSKE